MLIILLIAFFLRTYRLDAIPSCLEYDEAANVILAGEIATGKSFPVFIRPYTGKEILYFYLAAGMSKLIGVHPFALRMTSAFLGLLNVALSYWCTRELLLNRDTTTWGSRDFDRLMLYKSHPAKSSTPTSDRGSETGSQVSHWAGLFSATLVAISYWQVNLSRFGYRAIALPPLLALAIGSLIRGLRTDSRKWLLLAGVASGLSAYTYSSVRVFPILLASVWLWQLITHRDQWQSNLLHLALFGLAAAAVFAPLGIFFLHNPETFTVRLAQVSIFSPAASANQNSSWSVLWHTIRLAFGMFTFSGDMNPLYNMAGKPVFDWYTGAFFYLGLLICIGQLFRPVRFRAHIPRLACFVLLCWLLVMMVPNIISASGVPHNLRAMALVPAVFILTALGIVVPVAWLAQKRIGHTLVVLLLVLLVYEGTTTFHDYFFVWAGSAAPYYKGNEALIRAAALLDQNREADPYVATYFQQHATLAVTAHNYQKIRWMSDETLILPPPDAGPALLIYDHTNPVDPVLGKMLDGLLLHTELGPDGKTAFEAYRIDHDSRPTPTPQFADAANLGNTLTFLGYDINARAVSGGILDVTVYFEVLHPVEQNDFAFFAHLVDEPGFRWGEETFFRYPSAQWRQGEVMLFRLQLDIAPGTPPADYTLNLGVFSASLGARLPVLNETGQMAGTTLGVGPFEIASVIAAPETLPAIQHPADVTFGNTLAYLGSDRDRSDLRPGETLALTLYWQTLRTVDQDSLVSVWLAGPSEPLSLWQGYPVRGSYPFTRWQAGEFIRDRYALRIPTDTPSGDYELRLALLDEEGTPRLGDKDDAASLSLGTLHIHVADRRWEPPSFEYPIEARLGNADQEQPQIELLGYSLDRQQSEPGATLHLTLVWKCLDEMDIAYTVFTHLLDQHEQVRGQKDNTPVNGTYPTTLWIPGEIVVDEYDIPVAADAAAGEYAIEVGMYDLKTMQRLTMFDPTGAVGDRILLGDIKIEQAR
ncbi:MAG: glycosyltransferase family 39 protein [Anaerolineae bacterium]|nr:glycosyltransferase family 39 protein [Anaerolineae bacterium]